MQGAPTAAQPRQLSSLLSSAAAVPSVATRTHLVFRVRHRSHENSARLRFSGATRLLIGKTDWLQSLASIGRP